MNILITGGTGLIGTHLVPLLQTEHQITVLTRNVAHAEMILGAGIDYVSDLDGFTHLDEYDAVINLAGEPIVAKRWSQKQKQRLENSRWLLTQKLVDLCKASSNPPHCFISGSAIGYYGRQGETQITEDFTDVHAEFSQQLCQKWEEIALQAQSPQTRVCLLRTGIVLAKDQGALAKMLPPFKLGLGGPIGDGQHFMSWIHITDMVSAIVFLLQHDNCQGPFNLTAPNPVNNKTFAQVLAKSIHRPCLITTPKFALNLAMGEMAELLIYGQRVIPKKLTEHGFSFEFSEITPAFDDLAL